MPFDIDWYVCEMIIHNFCVLPSSLPDEDHLPDVHLDQEHDGFMERDT